MLFATAEDESQVVHLLNICTQKSLHVLLWIVSDLLEFIYG